MRSNTRHDIESRLKKSYHTPELTAYGDIREITQRNGGTVGMNDGGAGPDKTGF